MNEVAALGLVDVFSAIKVYAEVASTLPLHVFQRQGEQRKRVDDGAAVLLCRPAPAMTQAAFVAQVMACLVARGNVFIGKWRAGGFGEIEQLSVIPNERVRVETKGGIPFYVLTNDKGQQTTHTESDVIHVKGWSLDGIVGLSPIHQCREALGLVANLGQHASATFANGAVPRGVLTIPANHAAADDFLANLRDAFEQRHKGPENSGRIAVLSGEVQFHGVSLSPADSELVAQRKLSTIEVARIFRLPPWCLYADSGESMTYSNTESQLQGWVTTSLAPLLTAIEQALSGDEDLFPATTRRFCEFSLLGLLRPDSKTRSEIYASGLEHGYLTINEVRQRENLPPLPEVSSA